MLTSLDIVPKILDRLDWPSKGQAACVCRQWRLLAGSAEASLSAGKCWLTWQQLWPPEGPVLRHVQKCKLALCTDKLHTVDFSWPQLPALTAVHIEARLTATMGWFDCIHWNNTTVRNLSVTVLRSEGHCLEHWDQECYQLVLDVASSCLETFCVRAVIAETGLLIYRDGPTIFNQKSLGVLIDLGLGPVPALRQLLVCSLGVRVRSHQKDASQPGDCPTVSFSDLRAAFSTYTFALQLHSGAYKSGYGYQHAKFQDIFQLCERPRLGDEQDCLKGNLRLASDTYTMQQLQSYFEHGCYP